MQERIDKLPSTYMHRTSAWLVGAYSAAAFLLCVIGVYGVVSYSVSQRTRDVSVRTVPLAQRAAIYGLILKEAVWLAGIGTCLGAVGAIAAGTMARRLLFGVEPWDVTTVAAVGMTVICATLLASYIPARRAATVDAVTALRAECEEEGRSRDRTGRETIVTLNCASWNRVKGWLRHVDGLRRVA